MRTHAVVAILLGTATVASADDTGILGNSPWLTLGAPKVAGASGAAEIKAVIGVVEAAHDELQQCDPAGTSLTVTLTFTVGIDGKQGAVKATGLDKDGNACVVSAVSKLKFGKPKAKLSVKYPLLYGAGGSFVALTGTGDISNGGFDDGNIYGGLLGNESGELTGLGSGGFGPGGGGTGWGTIGTGRYGTIGHGSGGSGSGYGVGGGRGGMRGKGFHPTTSIGQPDAKGDLDKAIIRRYIKRNLMKITYCYEKELLKTPKLEGTVRVEFTISVNGTVTAAKGSGLANVDSCVAEVVRAIEFPKPKGGEVLVSYPFIFRPGDDTPPAAPAPAPAPAKP
jgi:TonB family protein